MIDQKIALITGGSSGIGKATALAFARKGAVAIIASRGEKRGHETVTEIKEIGGESVYIQADMSDPDSISGLISQAVDRFGRIDYAVNNAATSEGSFKFTADFDEEEFDRVMQTNVMGLWLCMKYEIHQMLTQNDSGGAIVNVSSVNGLGGAPQGSLYSASKSAVLALTKSAAQEYAKENIRINALVPGAFKTPMLDGVFEKASKGNKLQKEEIENNYARLSPFQRLGRPEEAANAAVWLCSDEASYVTGHSMIVDGGATAPFR